MNITKSESRLLLSLTALLLVGGLLMRFAGSTPNHLVELGELQSSPAQQNATMPLPLKLTGRIHIEGAHALESKHLLDIQLAALARYAEAKHGMLQIRETRYERPRSLSPQVAPLLSIEQAIQINLPAADRPGEIEAQLQLLGLRQISWMNKGQ